MSLKILLPVDRNRNSKTAERYAINFSKITPLKVTLLHVLNEKNLQGRGIGEDLKSMVIDNMRNRAIEILEDAAGQMKQADLEVELRIETGHPGSTICRIASDEGFDMVFITESGFSELGELLQGSVVSYVSHRCRIPVLMLKHGRES